MTNIDAESSHGAQERSVSFLERDGKTAGAVTLTRSYATTVEDLWDAVTNGGRISHWFLPVSGDLEPGGRYQLEGNASGVITACKRPSHFAFTWELGEHVSWVAAIVSDEGAGRARLAVTHTAHISERWSEYDPVPLGVGWELALMGLARHIARPNESMPSEATVATSPDGKAFIADMSEKWARAAVAAGTEREAAQEAAMCTTAFYTGNLDEPARRRT